MEFLNVKKDFEWVIRVLESCNSLTQVHTSDNLFEFVLKKWEIDLFEERKISYTSIYQKTKHLTNKGLVLL